MFNGGLICRPGMKTGDTIPIYCLESNPAIDVTTYLPSDHGHYYGELIFMFIIAATFFYDPLYMEISFLQKSLIT
jgi:hypothetical protein